MRSLGVCVLLAAVAGPAWAGVVFEENFDGGTLGGFEYRDYRADGESAFEWMNSDELGMSNFTGGAGGAAVSNSDAAPGPYDHAIVSPPIRLLGGPSSLSFLTNYQNFDNIDVASVDVTSDGGLTWDGVLRYNEDRGGFYSLPGEAALVDLTRYAGETVQVRFRHFNNNEDAFDWYWQVDEMKVESQAVPAPGALAILGAAGLVARRRR